MYQNLKGWLSQKFELQSFVFQKVPIWQQLLTNQLEGFEYNSRCLKRFSRKVQRKLRSAFFLKLTFLKIRLLVTWLKCLIEYRLDQLNNKHTKIAINSAIMYFKGCFQNKCLLKAFARLNGSRLLMANIFKLHEYQRGSFSVFYLDVTCRTL